MAANGSKRWIDDIYTLADEINDTRISRMGFAPNEVNAENEQAIYERFYATPRPYSTPKFKVGDRVRKAEPLVQFRRSFYPGWSPQIFHIVAVNRKTPNVYKLRDYYEKAIPGSFYAEELQKAKHPDYFLVEEVLERRGNRVLVKWWGYDKTDWVAAREVYDASADRRP